MLSEQTGTLQLFPDNGNWLFSTARQSVNDLHQPRESQLLCITIEQQGTLLTDEDAETVKSLHSGKAGVLSSDKPDD